MRELYLTFVACLLAGGYAYFFESGYTHHYTYWTETSLFSHKNVTTILKFQVTPVNNTENGHKLQSLSVTSLLQIVQSGSVIENPLQWDLSKKFLFETNENGSVTLVHCHSEDQEELIFIKKAIVSVFSVHVQMQTEEKEWLYNITEIDHLGELDHLYRAQRTENGLLLHRKHASSKSVHRFHEKILQYDHHGTLKSAEAKDRFLIRNKDNLHPNRVLMREEYNGKVSQSDHLPDIEAASTITVRLEHKSLSGTYKDVHHNMKQDTLKINKKEEKSTFAMLQDNITRSFECIRRLPERDNLNRSKCVEDLRITMKRMYNGDYIHFVDSILGEKCKDNDSFCLDKRLTVIDLVGGIGDTDSQRLLIKHVFNKTAPSAEDMKRVFVQCASMESPVLEFIQSIETICFGKFGELIGSRNMTNLQSRACLAIGSLIRHLHNGGQDKQVNHLAQRLETWLDEHAKVDKHISKRDTWLTDTKDEDHHMSKAILLHALGNAAIPRFRRHLVLHAEPNKGHHLWRRAALEGLRDYICQESAECISKSMLNDDIPSVRIAALALLTKHPRRNEFLMEHEQALYSANVTNTKNNRYKRDTSRGKVLHEELITSSPMHDVESVGPADIGGTTSSDVEESVYVQAGVLDTIIDVDFSNKMTSEAYIGLLNTRKDIADFEICYRGRLSYNINMLNDFKIESYTDIPAAFKHLVSELVKPMVTTIYRLSTYYFDPDKNLTLSGFGHLSQAVQQMTEITRYALNTTKMLDRALQEVGGLPILRQIKLQAMKLQSLMEDVHAENMDLYKNIAEPAIVTLPYAEREIRNSINMILNVTDKIGDYPKQTFAIIERALMGYQLAIVRIIEANSKIKQEISSISASRSTFMNAGSDLNYALECLEVSVDKLKTDYGRHENATGTFQELNLNLGSSLSDLYSATEVVVMQLTNLTFLGASAVQRGLDINVQYTQILLNYLEDLKLATDTIKSQINSILGQTFHMKFPKERRGCDSNCGCGYYPSGLDRFGYSGIDLKVGVDEEIHSPVMGIMFRLKHNVVVIQPVTRDMSDFNLILSNMIPSITIPESGVFVEDGQVIGRADTSSTCHDVYFNLAMRRSLSSNISDINETLTTQNLYLDPTPFMVRSTPNFIWQEECKDAKIKFKGQVVDFSKLTQGFQGVLVDVQKAVLQFGVKLPQHIPDLPTSSHNGNSSFAAGTISRILHDHADLSQLFNGEGETGQDIFDATSIAELSLETLNDIVKRTNDTEMINIMSVLMNYTHILESQFTNPEPEIIMSATTSALVRTLSVHGYNLTNTQTNVFNPDTSSPSGASVIDGRTGMLVIFKNSSTLFCPNLHHSLDTGDENTLCLPQHDCLGISCDIWFGYLFMRSNLHISVTVQQTELLVKIVVGDKEFDFVGNVDNNIHTGQNIFNHEVILRLRIQWEGRSSTVSLEVLACGIDSCLEEIELLKNASFQEHPRHKRFIRGLSNLINDVLHELLPDYNVARIANEILEDLYIKTINKFLSSILVALITQSSDNPEMAEEFQTLLEMIDKIYVPSWNAHAPLFAFFYIFPLGGIPVKIQFDAGGATGISASGDIQAMRLSVKMSYSHWNAHYIRGSVSLWIIVAESGMSLTGNLMKKDMETSLTVSFLSNGLPIQCSIAERKELIPMELELTVYWKFFFFIRIEFLIWHYPGFAISTHGVRFREQSKDLLRPRFGFDYPPLIPIPVFVPVYAVSPALAMVKTFPKTITTGFMTFMTDIFKGITSITRLVRPIGRRRRSDEQTCTVIQESGRHPTDTAFKLEFSAEDDKSDLQLWYAIGDYPHGTNVKNWTEMLGSSLLMPTKLPCGIPLYFSVKAHNSQGFETIASCSITTYDCTVPDGRVDTSYRCTSHPNKLGANVIVYDDSELVAESLFHAVGYSPSSFGHEVVNWLPLNLSMSKGENHNEPSNPLQYFGQSRIGRLTSPPRKVLKTPTLAQCASECLRTITCVNFAYNQYVQDCELQDVTEGSSAERDSNINYMTYDRLDKSYMTTLVYENMPLRHGTMYYVNAAIGNILGYSATLTSRGTMVDFTPPEPGPLMNVMVDEMHENGCNASIIQRCKEPVASNLNHRKIIDGKGSSTLFNGNRKGQETYYTMENFQISANWVGFKDAECGIFGFVWAVGTNICGTEIAGFTDPHSTIHNPDDWTNTGLAKNLYLPDGKYYVTLQAVSDIILGGDLVTTVCHSTPLIVDTTPPSLNSVNDILFDETFRHLVVYYDASDNISGVAGVEFGLGKTKYDVSIRPYLPCEIRGQGHNTYIVNEDFELPSGVSSWIRLKIVNNVGLSVTGSANAPILIDDSPPVAGNVKDGQTIGQDICCQSDTTKICAQWPGFFDPESNIESYEWGVGLSPGKDDILPFRKLSSFTKQSCENVQLHHNTTYFSTVICYNAALNQKSVNASSDGVLVDTTPPLPGVVVDGADVLNDANYTSETASVKASWSNFIDPESDLEPYSLSVFVNNGLQRTFRGISAETFTDHSFTFQHGDFIYVALNARNRAGGEVTVPSDGMLVDHTPPELIHLSSANSLLFQQQDNVLHFVWEFQDPESGISEYRCVVRELLSGLMSTFWPKNEDFYLVEVNVTSSSAGKLLLEGLSLTNGAEYSLKVTAVNKAMMASSGESAGVIVDTTAPLILKISLSPPGQDEEVNEDNNVEIVDGEPLSVTWVPQDSESGITESILCIDFLGSENCSSSISGIRSQSGFSPFTTIFSDLNFTVYSETEKVVYQVFIIVVNGAGVRSNIATSKSFIVLNANVAGTVIDGRKREDIDFSHDSTSIAMSFSGFSSESCGIDGYEWGVGTEPFTTEILPYTDYGLVVDSDGRGFAQAHIMLFEGLTYYSTVRAKTGYKCKDEYIVSSSNGFMLDSTPPKIVFEINSLKVTSFDVVYQTQSDNLAVKWAADDSSGVNKTLVTTNIFDTNPRTSHTGNTFIDLLPFSKLLSGNSLYSIISIQDKAGNDLTTMLPIVTFDFTPPTVKDLKCTKALSLASSVVKCTWMAVDELESPLSKIEIGLGSGSSIPDLMDMTSVPLYAYMWTHNAEDILSQPGLSHLYIIMRMFNSAGNWTEFSIKVIHDFTPPEVAKVLIVTSPDPGTHTEAKVCQTPQDYIEIIILGLEEKESELKSVEIALGSSTGRSDIKPFQQFHLVDGMYVMGNLALSKASTIYATVRVTNEVGLYTFVSSTGVVISSEPHLEVKDGPGELDIDGQSELQVMQGSWSYSDPCPVVSVQWSLQELGGEVILNFTDIPDMGNRFYNDKLNLEDFKTYINFVMITDALNRTFTAFSDGITVIIQKPDTTTILDGLGETDQDYQEPTDHLSANWDMFGNMHSTLPSEHIVRYEAAIGTDRRYVTMRSNVHAFEDVGLATSVTFTGLNLTAKSVIYYVTVRGHTAARTYVEASSDGIRVGYSAQMIPGRVSANIYQNNLNSIRFSWTQFKSDMVMTHYYAGVSTTKPSFSRTTYQCVELLKSSNVTFDIYEMQIVTSDFVTVIDGLTLAHGGTYYVTVVAADQMGQCSASVSNAIRVDTTPPVAGQISTDGYNADTIIILHSSETVTIHLEDMVDLESGIGKVELKLILSSTCTQSQDSDEMSVVASVTVLNESSIVLSKLNLQEGSWYFVKAIFTNGAGLDSTSFSQPMMLDSLPPQSGVVKLGHNWTAPEATFQNQTNFIQGMVALTAKHDYSECVTKRSLLSPENWREWNILGNQFTAGCVILNDDGLHVIVQHNPFLTGIERGAVQYQNITWRDGNFTFRLLLGKGKNILSGVSLTSPYLEPPFLFQNTFRSGNNVSGSCDTYEEDCISHKNQSISESALILDTDYGIGLSFWEQNGRTKSLFWVQDRFSLRQTEISFDFDPISTSAEYKVSLNRGPEIYDETWDVALYADGKIKTSFSGVLFSKEVVLSVYTWNVDDYVPPVTNIFTPFRAVMVVSSLFIPLDETPLCSYGSPFSDNNSGIKEIWIGLSNNNNESANVYPYQLVKSFCLPCIASCNKICTSCSNEFLSQQYLILPVSLSDLSLSAANTVLKGNITNYADERDSPRENETTNTEFDTMNLPSYYIDVRVVDHGGLITEVKSGTLLIDTSPPVIKFLRCFDPLYSQDESVEIIGNNHTVGVQWDTTDDISNVAFAWIYLGTQPFQDDISQKVQIENSRTSHIFENLKSLFEDSKVYFITLEVMNGAELFSKAYTNFTVLTTPPDISTLILTPANATIENFSGVEVAILESTEHLEINLGVDPSVASKLDVEYYEWAIGTLNSKDTVFPRTRVGDKNIKHVTINKGFIQLEGVPNGVNIHDFTNRNSTNDTLPESAKTQFLMEPGRCLKQQMYGLSSAHVESAIDIIPTCIKRKQDILVSSDSTTHELWHSGLNFTSVATSNSNEQLHMKFKLSKGGLIVGLLDDTDLDAEYGSSASTDFTPFIVRPDSQADPTSRWLFKRVVSMPGPSMFLSPVAEAQFENSIDIVYVVPNIVDVPADSLATLLFWNAGLQQWQSTEELCPHMNPTYNNSTRTIYIQLCPEVFSLTTEDLSSREDVDNITRVRRSSSGTHPPLNLGPRMLTVTVIRSASANTPPNIQDLSMSLLEDDNNFEFTIDYSDDEGDIVKFRLAGQPAHGNATISSDGRLQYTPFTDFSGTDIINVIGEEVLDSVSIARGIRPNNITFSITVNVTNINDPPDIFYLPRENSSIMTSVLEVGSAVGNGIHMIVLIQGNSTTELTLGSIIYGDVDKADNVRFMYRIEKDNGSEILLRNITTTNVLIHDMNLTNMSGIGGKEIVLSMLQNYSGNMTFDARVSDKSGVYSMQLSLGVYVLLNPCIHGHCEARDPTHSCQNPGRSHTFDPFVCRCDIGFEGQWCQTETDECRSAVCNPITDCVDLIGEYRCDVNPSKLAAIIICSLVTFIFVIVVVCQLKKKNRKVADSSNSFVASEIMVSSKLRDDSGYSTPWTRETSLTTKANKTYGDAMIASRDMDESLSVPEPDYPKANKYIFKMDNSTRKSSEQNKAYELRSSSSDPTQHLTAAHWTNAIFARKGMPVQDEQLMNTSEVTFVHIPRLSRVPVTTEYTEEDQLPKVMT